ncbi:MAG: hypothetical protein ACJ70O_06785 [Nitrososphaera sp.]
MLLVGLVFFGSKTLPELVRARALSSREGKIDNLHLQRRQEVNSSRSLSRGI